MNHGLNKVSARTKLVVGALALAMATLSHASTTQVGGGATLPAIGYVGTGAQSTTTQQVFPAGAGSLFGVYSGISGNPSVSYCQTGSGAGKNILAKVAGTSVQNACTAGGTGFGANFGTVGRSDLTQPNFAAADSPLSQTDFSNYTTNHSGNLPVQFPAVSGAISIGINKTSAKGTILSKSNTNFTDAQVCLIFSGQATDWGDSRLTSAYTGLASGDSVSGPIAVQFRSDGSGTSFSFSNHLSAVCSGTASAHFVTSQNFYSSTSPSTSVVGLYEPTLPSNWTGSSGNPKVAAAILATAGSIGYLETANSKQAGVNYAKVNGADPEANFGSTKFAVTTGTGGNLLFNEVINGANATTGRPVLQAISPLPTTSCIGLVDPSSYSTGGGTGYPIVAVSYLLGNVHGNNGDLANTRNLLGAPYNTAITNSRSLTLFGVNTGLALLNTGTAVTTSTVSACLID